MRLKRLILQGYKTFASRQEFVFDEGITAVVGPNGSGKSNVADALRWVLGEQSYGSLRGKKTEDMIFAGSSARPRAGMAQAFLTFDNSGGWLPIAFSEVEIGRRAYRSGENEYFVNGQKVRLRDVMDLLAASGLSERTYTIIGQGLIDRALSIRAEERRALFEEAAGINHYKSRRAETLKRLEETRHNLERVHDILNEIRPRLSSLKRQAHRAQTYHQLQADLHYLLRQQYGYQWEQARQLLRQKRQTAQQLEQRWQELRQQLQQQQNRLDQERQTAHLWQRDEQTHLKERDVLRQRLDKGQRQLTILQERHNFIHQQQAELEKDLPLLRERLAQSQTELNLAMVEWESAKQTVTNQQLAFAQFNTTFQAQQTVIQERQKQAQQTEESWRASQTKLAQLQGQLAQLQEQQGQQKENREASRLSKLEEELKELAGEEARLLAQLREWQQARVAKQKERQSLTGLLRENRQQSQKEGHQITAIQKEIAGLEARRDLLDQLRQKGAVSKRHLSLVGQFAQLVTIPAAYQVALEAVLGDWLSLWVADGAATLFSLLSVKGQSLAAVALEEIRPPMPLALPQDGQIIGWASEKVSYAPEHAAIVQLLLGRVLLVEDLATGYAVTRRLPYGTVAVTLDGTVIYAGGVVEIRPTNAANSVLAREAEWRATMVLWEEKQSALKREMESAGTTSATIRAQQTILDQLEREENQLLREEQTTTQQLHKTRSQLEQARQQHHFWQTQQENRQQERQRLEARLAAVQEEMYSNQQTVRQLSQALQEAQTYLQKLPIAELKQEQQSWGQKLEASRTILAGRQAVVDSRRTTLKQIEDQLRRQESRLTALTKEKEQMDLAEITEEMQVIQKLLQKLEEVLVPLQQALRTTQDKLGRWERESAGIHALAHDIETQFTQAKIALSQQETHLEGLRQRIKNDLGIINLPYDPDETGQAPLPMSDLVEQLPIIHTLPSDLEEEIQKYRAQLSRLGAINPDAPSEYETTQQRYDFLTQQVEDLHQTETQLRQIISELDRLTSQAFAETVKKVDIIFGDMFKRLFGGGSASLILTEPDNLTISGVEILARLPNRREQGLGLLSGGERSLTAAALIFALLKVAPTPFCVLDEVDAMLDEANVNRFTDLLQELSQKTQFIVVTHNRGTVQVAKTVYGISMGLDSASRVLSIRPEEYLHKAEIQSK